MWCLVLASSLTTSHPNFAPSLFFGTRPAVVSLSHIFLSSSSVVIGRAGLFLTILLFSSRRLRRFLGCHTVITSLAPTRSPYHLHRVHDPHACSSHDPSLRLCFFLRTPGATRYFSRNVWLRWPSLYIFCRDIHLRPTLAPNHANKGSANSLFGAFFSSHSHIRSFSKR